MFVRSHGSPENDQTARTSRNSNKEADQPSTNKEPGSKAKTSSQKVKAEHGTVNDLNTKKE